MCHLIGYTYEADIHCPACARKAFPILGTPDITVIDREGNEIAAMYDWEDEGLYPIESCGTCGSTIYDDGTTKRCDQCAPNTVQGIFCHEHGCPNARKAWDVGTREWVTEETKELEHA